MKMAIFHNLLYKLIFYMQNLLINGTRHVLAEEDVKENEVW